MITELIVTIERMNGWLMLITGWQLGVVTFIVIENKGEIVKDTIAFLRKIVKK